MSPEQQSIQAGHAALESAYAFGRLGEETHIVLLGIASEADLLAAHDRLTRKNIRTYLMEEDNGLGFTAIGSEPIVSNQRRKVFFPYEKLRHAEVAQ